MSDTDDSASDTDDSEREAVAAHIEALAQAHAPQIVAKSAEALELFKADHEADCLAYEFRCQRWGDFLSLMMHRQQPAAPFAWYRPPPEKTVVAVNLGESVGITLREGHPADAFGEARLAVSIKAAPTKDGGGGWLMSASGPPDLRWPKNGKWVTTPELPRLAGGRNTIVVPVPGDKGDPVNRMLGYSFSGPYARFTMPHARPAEDDVIEFANGVKLHAPAGIGQGVFEKVLAAIAEPTQ